MTQPQSGKPHKLTERDHRMLKLVARKNHLSSLSTLTMESQMASGSNFSIRTACREHHEMGFHGQAAAQKPKILRSLMPSIG